MKLNAHLEIINNQAYKAGLKSTTRFYYSTLSLAKDQKSNQYFLIVNNTKKPIADKFKLKKNIEKIFCRFVNEGKATVVLKEPSFNLNLQKAEVSQLKSFLKVLHLAANSPNFNDDSIAAENQNAADLDKENKQLKKPITSISIKSRKDYNSNFKAIISQNLSIRSKIDSKQGTTLNLMRLTISECELKHVNKSIFELKTLEYLDMSNNKLTVFEDFSFENLHELILANNEIKYIGKKFYLPKLAKLDLSNNSIMSIDYRFCENFKHLNTLNLKSNKIIKLTPNFGYKLLNLKYFDVSMNQLNVLPYSLSYLRLEMLDLQGNPYDFGSYLVKPKQHKFPTLVELAARKIVNKKVKYVERDIPSTLYEYSKSSNRCICGQACFEYNFNLVTMYAMSQISKSYSCFSVKGFNNQIPCQLTLCSWRCHSKNLKMQKVLDELKSSIAI